MALICLTFDILKLLGGTEGNILLINGVVSFWQFSVASVWVVVFKLTALHSGVTHTSVLVRTTANANNVGALWACTPLISASHLD